VEQADEARRALVVAQLAEKAGRGRAQLGILRRQPRPSLRDGGLGSRVSQRLERELFLAGAERRLSQELAQLIGCDERESGIERPPPAEVPGRLGEIRLEGGADRLPPAVRQETVACGARHLPLAVAERLGERVARAVAAALAEVADGGPAPRRAPRASAPAQAIDLPHRVEGGGDPVGALDR